MFEIFVIRNFQEFCYFLKILLRDSFGQTAKKLWKLLLANFSLYFLLLSNYIQTLTFFSAFSLFKHPRKEAVTLLGSLLCFPAALPSMRVYNLNAMASPSAKHTSDEFTLCQDLRVRKICYLFPYNVLLC